MSVLEVELEIVHRCIADETSGLVFPDYLPDDVRRDGFVWMMG